MKGKEVLEKGGPLKRNAYIIGGDIKIAFLTFIEDGGMLQDKGKKKSRGTGWALWLWNWYHAGK